MAFSAEVRKEKPGSGSKPDTVKKQDKVTGKNKDGRLDKALKDTFPASDPVAKEQIVTGARTRKPKLPE